MRIVVLLLLIVNFTFFVYTRIDESRRDSQPSIVTRFRELQTQSSGTDLKVGACPIPS